MPQIIGVSQRVAVSAEFCERRDALDQRWTLLLAECDAIPLLLPNHQPTVGRILEKLPIDGFLLTGGNSLVALGGDAAERDAVERTILDAAVAQRIPLLGVCRGMQMIQHYFGLTLEHVESHVGQPHKINALSNSRVVNSFHHFGTRRSQPDLEILATADDGVVEAIRHRTLPIAGLMWHPERCEPFDPLDVCFIKNLFLRPT